MFRSTSYPGILRRLLSFSPRLPCHYHYQTRNFSRRTDFKLPNNEIALHRRRLVELQESNLFIAPPPIIQNSEALEEIKLTQKLWNSIVAPKTIKATSNITSNISNPKPCNGPTMTLTQRLTHFSCSITSLLLTISKATTLGVVGGCTLYAFGPPRAVLFWFTLVPICLKYKILLLKWSIYDWIDENQRNHGDSDEHSQFERLLQKSLKKTNKIDETVQTIIALIFITSLWWNMDSSQRQHLYTYLSLCGIPDLSALTPAPCDPTFPRYSSIEQDSTSHRTLLNSAFSETSQNELKSHLYSAHTSLSLLNLHITQSVAMNDAKQFYVTNLLPILKTISYTTSALIPLLRQLYSDIDSQTQKDDEIIHFINHHGPRIRRTLQELGGYYSLLVIELSNNPSYFPSHWAPFIADLNDNPPTPLACDPFNHPSFKPLLPWFDAIVPTPSTHAGCTQRHPARLHAGPLCTLQLLHSSLHDYQNDCRSAHALFPDLPTVVPPRNTSEALHLLIAAHDLEQYHRIRGADKSDNLSSIVIPRPVPHLCSPDVLVTEYTPGTPITQLISLESHQNRVNNDFHEQILRFGHQPKSNYFANKTETSSNVPYLTKAFHFSMSTAQALWNSSIGWALGCPWQLEPLSSQIMDKFDEIIGFYGYQMFHGNLFPISLDHQQIEYVSCQNGSNVDHALHITRMPQAVALTLYQRAILAQYVIAIARGDTQQAEMISQFAIIMGNNGIGEDLVLNKQHPPYLSHAFALQESMTHHVIRQWAISAEKFLATHPVLKEMTNNIICELSHISLRNCSDVITHTQNIAQWAHKIGDKYDSLVYNRLFIDIPSHSIWPGAEDLYTALDARVAARHEALAYIESLTLGHLTNIDDTNDTITLIEC